MGKNKKEKVVIVAGVRVTGAKYGCYASRDVVNAVNAIAKADMKIQVAKRIMHDKRVVYESEGYGAEAVKCLLEIYADDVREAEADRTSAIEWFKSCADYSISGVDEFGFELVDTRRNVFGDMFRKFKTFHTWSIDDFKKLVFRLGFTKDFESMGSDVASDLMTIIDALSVSATYRKYAGKLDKDKVYNAVNMVRSKEFKTVEDLVLAVRAVVVDFWASNRHFVRRSDGTYEVPDWAFTDGVYDENAEQDATQDEQDATQDEQ